MILRSSYKIKLYSDMLDTHYRQGRCTL